MIQTAYELAELYINTGAKIVVKQIGCSDSYTFCDIDSLHCRSCKVKPECYEFTPGMPNISSESIKELKKTYPEYFI